MAAERSAARRGSRNGIRQASAGQVRTEPTGPGTTARHAGQRCSRAEVPAAPSQRAAPVGGATGAED